jgi:hypothetical protein
MEPTPPGPSTPIAFQSDQTGANFPPLTNFENRAPWHYIKEAVRIIVWNEDAVHRTKDDPIALPYGICFWVVANTVGIITLMSVSHGRFVFPLPSRLVAVLPNPYGCRRRPCQALDRAFRRHTILRMRWPLRPDSPATLAGFAPSATNFGTSAASRCLRLHRSGSSHTWRLGNSHRHRQRRHHRLRF